jgi:hypothetical protein
MSLTCPWFPSGAEWGIFITKLGIGIEANAAGIGIPALCISVRFPRNPYRTGYPYPGTGLVPASSFLFIPVPDWPVPEMSDIPALMKMYTMQIYTTSDGMGYTLHVHAAGGGKGTPCTSLLLVVEKGCTQHVYIAGFGNGYSLDVQCPYRWWWKGIQWYTMHVHTSCGGWGTTGKSIRLAWKGILCMSYTAVGGGGERDTSCTSKLKEV